MATSYGYKTITNKLAFCADAGNISSYVPPSSPKGKNLIGGAAYTLEGSNYISNNQGCFDFDGVDNYIQSTNLIVGNIFSMETWINTNNEASVASDTILGSSHYFTTTFNGNFIWKMLTSNQLSFLSFDGNTNAEGDTVTVPNISTDSWYNVCVSCNGVTITTYFNGEAKGSDNHTKSLGDLNVGGLIWGDDISVTGATNNPWDGKIGPVKIYDYALTSTEVLQNYNALKPRFGL